MFVALLVAGAALAHATWNVAIKRAGTSGPSFIWAGILVGALVFAPFGITSLLSQGSNLLAWLPLAAVSGVLQVAYLLLLQRGDVGVEGAHHRVEFVSGTSAGIERNGCQRVELLGLVVTGSR